MKVLVVGAGLMGRSILDEIHSRGMQSRVLTRSAVDFDHEDLAVGDAASQSVVDKAIDGIDHVFMCHNGHIISNAESDPVGDLTGCVGPLVALERALTDKQSVGVTFFSSGGAIYGDAAVVPTPETEPAKPRGFYGANRLTSEQYLNVTQQRLQNPIQVLRCTNPYGPNQDPSRGWGLVSVVRQRLEQGLPIQIFGDGSAERDYIYTRDIARAAVELAVQATPGFDITNLGSGHGSSIMDVVQVLGDVLEVEPKIEKLPARGFDVQRSIVDISKLKSKIRFEPLSLTEGLAAMTAAAN